MKDFPEPVLRSTAYWLERFSREYRGEVPMSIHSRGVSPDGSPPQNVDFSRYIQTGEVISTPRPQDRTPEDRLRTTRAMRRLRREAIREFEVVYRVMVLGERVADTTRWLNDRAARNGIPVPSGRDVHYRRKDTVAIIISGIDKMSLWY